MGEVTGPLLRLERDADPGDLKFPHRLIWKCVLIWLTEAEAADFESRYWTGDLPRPEALPTMTAPEIAGALRDGKTVEVLTHWGWRPTCWSGWGRTGLNSPRVVARVVGEDTPTPPAARVLPEGVREAADDDLPEGFVRLPSGRIVADAGAMSVAGWAYRFDAANDRWDPCSGLPVPIASDEVVEVRPIPAPEPELVPWHESVGRTEPAGNVFEECGRDQHGPWLSTTGNDTRLRSLIDSSGMVLCLPITDGDGQ